MFLLLGSLIGSYFNIPIAELPRGGHPVPMVDQAPLAVVS